MTTTTVKQLIEYLQTCDQDAEVELVDATAGDSKGLDVKQHVDYVDYRGNPFVKPDAPYFNKRFLIFG